MKQKKHETHKMLYDLIITTQLVAVERWQILEESRYAGRAGMPRGATDIHYPAGWRSVRPSGKRKYIRIGRTGSV